MSVALPIGRRRSGAGVPTGTLAMGVSMLWISLIVVLPLAAVVAQVARRRPRRVLERGDVAAGGQRDPLHAARLPGDGGDQRGLRHADRVGAGARPASAASAAVNAVIDLPFALPTIVAGLTLLALYGPNSPIGVNVALTQFAVLLALLFVTLPFVIRSVQPVLLELDREMEEAAASLGARPS